MGREEASTHRLILSLSKSSLSVCTRRCESRSDASRIHPRNFRSGKRVCSPARRWLTFASFRPWRITLNPSWASWITSSYPIPSVPPVTRLQVSLSCRYFPIFDELKKFCMPNVRKNTSDAEIAASTWISFMSGTSTIICIRVTCVDYIYQKSSICPLKEVTGPYMLYLERPSLQRFSLKVVMNLNRSQGRVSTQCRLCIEYLAQHSVMLRFSDYCNEDLILYWWLKTLRFMCEIGCGFARLDLVIIATISRRSHTSQPPIWMFSYWKYLFATPL